MKPAIIAGLLAAAAFAPLLVCTPMESEPANPEFSLWETAQRMLEKGDMSARDACGMTVLHGFAVYGDVGNMATALARGADLNAQDNCGRTALMLAAMSRGDAGAAVRFLLEHGARRDLMDQSGKTVWDYATQLHHSSNPEALQTLLMGRKTQAILTAVEYDWGRPSAKPKPVDSQSEPAFLHVWSGVRDGNVDISGVIESRYSGQLKATRGKEWPNLRFPRWCGIDVANTADHGPRRMTIYLVRIFHHEDSETRSFDAIPVVRSGNDWRVDTNRVMRQTSNLGIRGREKRP